MERIGNYNFLYGFIVKSVYIVKWRKCILILVYWEERGYIIDSESRRIESSLIFFIFYGKLKWKYYEIVK